jgi:hypothetical protein
VLGLSLLAVSLRSAALLGDSSWCIQAIDKLENMLNGGMDTGQTNMFGPKEYVAIYT